MSAFACFHFQGYNDYSDQYHQKQFERIYLDFHTRQIEEMRYSSSANSTEEYLKSIDEESLHMLADYVLARHGIEAFKNLITLLPPHLRRLLELTIDPCGPQVDLVNEILAMSPVRH